MAQFQCIDELLEQQKEAKEEQAREEISKTWEKMSIAGTANHRNEINKLFPEIVRGTHEDLINRESFNEQQRDELKQIFQETMELRKKRNECHEAWINLKMRLFLDRINDIYDLKGIDLEPGTIVKGETLTERTIWLTGQTSRLCESTKNLKNDLHAERNELSEKNFEEFISMEDEIKTNFEKNFSELSQRIIELINKFNKNIDQDVEL